jgi:hypothetical protein
LSNPKWRQKNKELISSYLENLVNVQSLRFYQRSLKISGYTRRDETMLKKKEKFPKDDYDFELPKFNTKEEFEAWLNALETYDAEVDERLKEQRMISMQVSKFMVDGYNYLAKEDGLKDGLTLMYMVLNQYLNENLPEDF